MSETVSLDDLRQQARASRTRSWQAAGSTCSTGSTRSAGFDPALANDFRKAGAAAVDGADRTGE